MLKIKKWPKDYEIGGGYDNALKYHEDMEVTSEIFE
jgi:hypothetical protein